MLGSQGCYGLDAETEVANILSAEILAEINREVIRSIYVNAKLAHNKSIWIWSAALHHLVRLASVQKLGIYDVDALDGRWSAEKFRGLMFQIDREANVIAKSSPW